MSNEGERPGDPHLMMAERAMHARMGMALDAVSRAGVAGQFRAFDEGGLLTVLTTARGLGFLNTVTVTDVASIRGVPDVLNMFHVAGAAVPIVVSADEPESGNAALARLGLEPAGDRPIAVISLQAALSAEEQADDGTVRVTAVRTPQDRALFLDVLLAGYDADAEVERLIRAEHSSEEVSAFVAWIDDEPVAAAAMSLHGECLVLGGAATLAARRGSGAQTALLRAIAMNPKVRALGDRDTPAIAAATAAPGSPSLRNMERAGFAIYPRRAWRLTDR